MWSSNEAIFCTREPWLLRGYAYARVSAIGTKTRLAAIEHSLGTVRQAETPLQAQVRKFVRLMVIAGSLAFLLVWGYKSWETGSIIHGLLHGLTMAMSVIPEEIPVAMTTFLALGAYRLLKIHIIASSAPVRGNPRFRNGNLCGQDRHAYKEPDAGSTNLGCRNPKGD
ncbi:MAG: hypothetical protein H6561_11605 [Lewinellaceae bacterium]|nr:hypothetical protein [Lewinellaceae bacterium]